MYLVICSILFALAARFKTVRHECIILCVVSLLTGIFSLTLSADGAAIYWLRAITTTFGALALCGCRSQFGFYQAAIYAMVMILYLLLAIDVVRYNAYMNDPKAIIEPIALVWGDRYRMAAHGLVICQFVGFIPLIWSYLRARLSISNYHLANIFRGKEG
jgi:hypothetical protein